jgi:NADPH:quinone reductase-like Zn-dependent oxidoreductase
LRQVWITQTGGAEVLAIKEAPDPEPTAGEVPIRVEASGVNFADILARLGRYPDLPKIPAVVGYEVSGRVDAIGAGVDREWIGRDVLAGGCFCCFLHRVPRPRLREPMDTDKRGFATHLNRCLLGENLAPQTFPRCAAELRACQKC